MICEYCGKIDGVSLYNGQTATANWVIECICPCPDSQKAKEINDALDELEVDLLIYKSKNLDIFRALMNIEWDLKELLK